MMGFIEDTEVFKPISELSMGEKSRLNMLKILIEKVPRSFLHQAEITFTYSPIHNLEFTLDYQLLFPGAGMMNFNGWNFTPGSPVSASYIEVEWTPVFYPRKKKHTMVAPYAPGNEPR